MADFTMKSNVQLSMKGVSLMEKMLRATVGDALKQLGPQVAKEGSRMLEATRYSSLTRSQYRKLIETRYRGNKHWPLDKQYAAVDFSGKALPLTAFNPKTVPVETRVGKRYAVDVTVFGKTIRTGGFHLKGTNPLYGGPQVHQSPFTAMSKVFKREGRSRLPINRYLFISPGRLLQTSGDAEKDLMHWGYSELYWNLLANWKRREGQYLRGKFK